MMFMLSGGGTASARGGDVVCCPRQRLRGSGLEVLEIGIG
jgi:hypothetical protein